jgi:hypothetical protein
MLRKWRLMLSTLPYVAAMLGAKMALHYAGFDGIVKFSDVGLVLTGGIFLIGFMLAGTMADFKEAERLPAEIAASLETLEETFHQATLTRPTLDSRSLRAAVLKAVDGILDCLGNKRPRTEIFTVLEGLRDCAGELEKGNAGPYAGRSLAELHTLRRWLSRVHVISRTGFLSSGYALLEAMTACIFALLLASRFENPISENTLIAFVSLIYVYMIRLIRDIDDPFEYGPSGALGAGEVELFPLEDYRARLKARVDTDSAYSVPDAQSA